MNRIRELFKSNKFKILFAMAMTFTTIIFFNIVDSTSEVNLEIAIMPVLCLLWGPFGILGFIIVESIYLLVFDPHDAPYVLKVIIIFCICNMLMWKLWYSTMNRDGMEIPNFNKLYNIIKFLAIFLIYVAGLYILLNGLVKGQYDVKNLHDNIIILSPLSILIMIIGIHLAIKYKIPVYTPKGLKQVLPKKVYPILLIAAIIIGMVNTISDNNAFDSTIISILVMVLMIIYITKPFGENYTINEDININLFNKINSSLFLLLLILLAITTLPLYVFIPGIITPTDVLSNFAYIIEQFISLIIIPVLIYMYYLEKNMTKPINKLTKSLSRNITTPQDYQKLNEDLNSITVNNELKSLAGSLLEMEEDLNLYRKQLVEVTSQKERFETEMKLGHDIQDSMIPKNFEEYNNGEKCEIWGMMEPAREVAGDFYDFFKIDDDNIGFVIGDVSGKGITASLIMVKAMTLIQDYAIHFEDLSDVFYEVNNLLCEGNVENLFVTCWLGKINFKTKKLSYVNAGHNPPLIKQNENFEYYNINPGVVLAAMEDMPYETNELQLKSGDAIILYTDGITEANYNYNDFYGEERLKDILNKHKNDDLEKIITSVKKDIDDFCENQEQFDDTTMFAIRLK
ncbi:PP2C family protein-serine/threonine phosphatase [uncultured Methanobrevibacter sp.]|uniref:PP2C family protein-serine/threonine phosphatase n=1 Tax=uncultured Methanobrevibacter sp. TaxID=253161 RepID=UPI0025D30576|nr:PP2C family protein-serine/threonine phosphatase [uncultured Methanobrevibacter sp.]